MNLEEFSDLSPLDHTHHACFLEKPLVVRRLIVSEILKEPGSEDGTDQCHEIELWKITVFFNTAARYRAKNIP